jgi:DNA-binding NtrC family response regulator
MLLADLGANVHGAECAQSATEVIGQGFRPDVVVTDYRLPDQDGLTLLDEVRNSVGEEIPGIVVTGDMAVNASSVNRIALLHKPLRIEKLTELIQAMCNKTPLQHD